MRAELEQGIVRRGRQIEIDDDRNFARLRRPAHRGDEFGKAVVDQHGVGIRNERVRIAGSTWPSPRPRRVAMVFSPVGIDQDQRHRGAWRRRRARRRCSRRPRRARSARMRALTASSSPPSGPAKAARPPSRAIATAALAAQPPPVMMKSLATALAPGGGNARTRMTMSCTAMPAHRIFGAACARSGKADLAVDPGADDVMGDRDRRRRAQPVADGGAAASARPRRARTSARLPVPSRSTTMSVRQRLGVAADHQRHRERPGLRGEIATRPTTMPASSRVSRRTASSIVSPGSTKPARHDHISGSETRLSGRAGSGRRRPPA